MEYIKWLEENSTKLKTKDLKDIKVFQFDHKKEEEILSSWAKHFREHYCLDDEIDIFRAGTGKTRSEYLIDLKFPDKNSRLGPGIRAGDFGEILISDYLEYVLNYYVPRTRYCDKVIRNESTKGSDVMGFKINDYGIVKEDTLIILKRKLNFQELQQKRLQDAIDDSSKDYLRIAESLNAVKRKLYYDNKIIEMNMIERFQNQVDFPYKKIYGAAALFDENVFKSSSITCSDCSNHSGENIDLVVIYGKNMMSLVHELYRRAADEAGC